jgi:tetratricopeptide (TPR) repeat protein
LGLTEHPQSRLRRDRAGAALLGAVILALVSGVAPCAAADALTPGIGDEAEGASKTEGYIAQLRAVMPQSWLGQEFQRQRSFPALARSRQLATKGRYDEALAELEQYLATDADDLVVRFEYLALVTNLKRYQAAIDAADRILVSVPDFAPARYYRGLARAALDQNEAALPDLAAAARSGALAPDDALYAQRSLAAAALASPATAKVLTLLDRETAKSGADGSLLVAKGQLLERLGRTIDAATAYDFAAKRAPEADDRRAAGVFGAELALKRGDPTGALSRSLAAWKLAPGNPDVTAVLLEAASRLGRTDLVEAAERETKAAGIADRSTREMLANALFRVGRNDQANAIFDDLAATAANPADEYRLRRAAGFAAQAAKDLPRAQSELQRAAAINPVPEALSAAAEASLQAGHLDVAATDLRRLADTSEGQDQAGALKRLSIVEEQGGHFSKALGVLDQISADWRDADVERRSAVLATKAGDKDAVVVYTERLANLEATRTNLRALGEAQLAASQPAAAIRSFEEALRLEPADDPVLREMLANAHVAAGQPALAAKEFDALAGRAKFPADEYRLRLASGFAALKAGDLVRALAAFRQAKELDAAAEKAPPRADEYRLRLAAGFAALGADDASGALAAFRQAVELEANRRSLEGAAEAAIRSGQLGEAAGYLERLATAERDLLSSAQYLERLSIIYEMMGRTKESAEALQKLPKPARGKPEIIRREAVLAQKLGDRKTLLADMSDLVAAEPSEENLAALADAQIAAGQSSAAEATLGALLTRGDLSAERKALYLERLGNIAATRGNAKRAQALFTQSYQLAPTHPAEWLTQAAESAMQTRDWETAARTYRELVSSDRVSGRARGGYAGRLGFALANMSRDKDALAAYDMAMRLGAGTPALRENRGTVLMRLGRPAEAVPEFRAAYDAHPRPDLALSLAYAHQAAHQPGLAIVYLKRALADPHALSAAQQWKANAALGYAYAETEQYEQSARCFAKALGAAAHPSCAAGNNHEPSMQQRLTLSLALARSYRLAGQPQKALETLQPLGGGPWPSTATEAEYHDEVARAEDALGRPSEALIELQKAVALEPTAERRFRLGQLAERLGDHAEARRQLEEAVAADPGNTEYKAALAYTLRRSGESARAAQLMSEVLAAEPKRYTLHEDLGYTYLSLGENERAIEQFKWVIDNRQLYPAETPEERMATERKMAALRETVSSVEPHWTALAYSNLCLSGTYCNRRITNLGSLLSANQGGIELAYQPPEIGYVDGRILQGFARTYFSYSPGTVNPQGESFQGGVGLRYKPLSDYNLVLSGERMVRLGSASQNNWMARAAFSTSTGAGGYIVEPEAGRPRYSLLYLDLAATLASPRQYLTYGDVREGLNFRLTDRVVISPFVYGIFRGNYGVGPNTSAETGVGLSLRGFFDFIEDEYHAPRDAIEILPRLGYTVYDSLAPTSVVFSLTAVARF